MKKIIPFWVALFVLITSFSNYAQQPIEQLLCSFSTTQKMNGFIFPKFIVDEGCELKVDAGDGSIANYVVTNFASLKVKGKTIKFYTSTPEKVREVSLTMSKLTEANFSGCIAANNIRIDVNSINAVAMEALMKSLPQTTNGKLLVKAFTNNNDKNEVYKSAVKIARSKGWVVYGYSGHFSNAEVYDGEDEPGGGDDKPIAVSLKSSGNIITLKVKGNGEMAYQIEGEQRTVLTEGTNMVYNATDKIVTLYGDFTELVCFQSDLVQLEIKEAPNLVYLNCCANNLDINAMAKLIEGLPQNNTLTKKFIPIDSTNEYEKNSITQSLIELATTKNWKVLDWNAGLPQPIKSKVPAIAISTKKQKGDLIDLRIESNDDVTLDMGDGKIIKASNLEPIYELKGDYIHLFGDITIATIANVGATSIDCSQAKNLIFLDCSNNFLNDNAFEKLVNSLPKREKQHMGEIVVRNPYVPSEKNTISHTNVTALREKNWHVWQKKEGEGKEYEDYEGDNFVPDAPLALKMTTDTELGKTVRVYIEGVTDLWVNAGDGNYKRLSSKGGFNDILLKGREVSFYGNITWFAAQNGKLTMFEVLNAPLLKSLFINENYLTTLDVSKATALEFLNCARNKISGEGIVTLVNSLYDATKQSKKPQLYIVDSASAFVNENTPTSEQLKIAFSKGWEVRNYNGGANDKPIYNSNTSVESTAKAIVYYNPSTSQCFVNSTLPHHHVVLFSLNGVCLQNTQTNARGEAIISLDTLPNGTYFVQIGAECTKLLKQH